MLPVNGCLSLSLLGLPSRDKGQGQEYGGGMPGLSDFNYLCWYFPSHGCVQLRKNSSTFVSLPLSLLIRCVGIIALGNEAFVERG